MGSEIERVVTLPVRWSTAELIRLRWAIKHYHRQWKRVAEYVGRSVDACKRQHRRSEMISQSRRFENDRKALGVPLRSLGNQGRQTIEHRVAVLTAARAELAEKIATASATPKHPAITGLAMGDPVPGTGRSAYEQKYGHPPPRSKND